MSFEGHVQSQGKGNSYNSFYQYQMPMGNMFSNMNMSFSTKFPRAKDYFNQDAIIETFPHLEGINDLEFDLDGIPENAHFYILRSSNDDNIHKAIKYHLWSSTTSGKGVLSHAWKDFEKRGEVPEIYLIFSVVNSNHVLGVAKMISDVKDDETFMFWWEPMKWFGSFQIKWLFIKDIHYSKFEHIRDDTFGSSSFINLKDSTRFNVENGKEVLRIFRDYMVKSNIFGSFAYMDRREDYIRLQRESNSYFLNYFEECCAAYQKDPERFSPRRNTQYNRKGARYNGNSNFFYPGQKKPGNMPYRKIFYNNKQQGSPNNNFNGLYNMRGPQYSREEYPSVSLAEQFGIKTLNKKNRVPKTRKNMKEGKDQDMKNDEADKENVCLNN
jgi:hypothetical protein